jgi:hypothetical protein
MAGSWDFLRNSKKLDAKLRAVRHSGFSPERELRDRVEELEDDLGRALLLLHAVCEASLSKGLFTQSELDRFIEAIDVSDGRADGKLDPATQRPDDSEEPPVVF